MTQAQTISDCPVDEREIMKIYYQKFFPFRHFFHWLNHSNVPTNDFANRELAYTLEDGTYVRYKSFPTAEEFKKDLVQVVPFRFEIGAVYRINPRDRKTVRKDLVKPVSKEFVIDIDLTDYNDVRTCCDEAKICNKCWGFITVSIKVLDKALREDFGFEDIMWVYSGRRGAHAWVCDRRARDLTDPQRVAIASYLQVVGQASGGKLVDIKRPMHPHLARSFEILKHEFPKLILRDQDLWESPEAAKKLAEKLPDDQLAHKLIKKWESNPSESSKEKWLDIDKVAADSDVDTSKLMESKQDIIFECTYPRLDAAVSKQLNHLLKSPFCVHPKTGRVCVPIDLATLDNFDPFEVPTVNLLIEQLTTYDIDNGNENDRMESYMKTSLAPYVEIFHKFANQIVSKETARQKREREESLEF